MEIWEQITKAALLGTQKYSPEEIALPSSIQSILTTLPEKDREDALLRKAVFAHFYCQAGKEFPVVKGLKFKASDPEVLPYCNREAVEILRRILYEKQDPLLEVFLQEMAKHKLLISPELIPALLDKGKEYKEIRPQVRMVCGNRGEWLATLHPEWQYLSTGSPQEIWQTGTLDARKELLLQLRKQDPGMARIWLMETWKTEKSTTKAAFLKVFSINLSMADEPMLEQLLPEKARIVKEEVESLLFRLKNSRLINRIWAEVQPWVSIHKKANSLKVQIMVPAMLPSSLEQLGIIPSRDKFLTQSQHIFTANPTLRSFHPLVMAGLTESESWLYQVFLIIPPQRWKHQFNLDDETLIELLLNDENYFLIPALANAAILHQDTGLIKMLLTYYLQRNRFLGLNRDKSGYYLRFNLIAALPWEEKQFYESEVVHLLEQDDFQFYNYLEVYNYEWSISLSRQVLKKIAEKCSSGKYYYHFYEPRQIQKLSQYLPPAIIPEWESLQPTDDMGKARWQQATSLLFNSLDLKLRIRMVFHN